MNEPLLIPHILQCPRRRFARQRQDCRSTEGSEADLCQRSIGIERLVERPAGAAVVDAAVRIPGIRKISVAEQINAGNEVGLEERIDIDVMSQIPAIPAIGHSRGWNWKRIYSILYSEPARKRRHIVPAGLDC